mmetsp:Transcript_3611/g.6323  ORF Transcript_3611/g.6323 Transcript_3611/m.6323 type:complete len:237 (-) Transcript_3611:656-1366(-)
MKASEPFGWAPMLAASTPHACSRYSSAAGSSCGSDCVCQMVLMLLPPRNCTSARMWSSRGARPRHCTTEALTRATPQQETSFMMLTSESRRPPDRLAPRIMVSNTSACLVCTKLDESSPMRCRNAVAYSARSRTSTRSLCPMKRGNVWWHTMRPHSTPLTTTLMVREAATPMFFMYSEWQGMVPRMLTRERSAGLRVRGLTAGTMGTSGSLLSHMARTRWLRYSFLMTSGMSEAGK